MRVVLLDDFSPIIDQTLSSWNWQAINGQNWTVEDFKKNASEIDLFKLNLYSKFFRIHPRFLSSPYLVKDRTQNLH